VPAFPLVAVSSTIKLTEGAVRVRLNDSYLRAIEDARLTPLVTAPLADLDRCGDVLDAVRGLVLTGGEDVNPAEYGAEPHPALGEINPRRDRWEIALVREARARRIPTLAICRGIQILNVALGGTLVQDIPAQWPGALPHEDGERGARSHPLEIVTGSATEGALGGTLIAVNSIHHQAIDKLASGLRITARSPDGLVEAVETEDDGWWVVGVQWHPEELTCTAEPWDRGLFAAFAERCRR
jgi:putative glutamine amidotransferase